jgi:hypothetical protein
MLHRLRHPFLARYEETSKHSSHHPPSQTLTPPPRGHLGPNPYNPPRLTHTFILGQQRRTHRLRKQQVHLRTLHRQPLRLKAIHCPHRPNNRRPLLAQRLLHRIRRRDRLRARVGQHRRREHQGRIPHHRRPHQRYRVGRRQPAHYRCGRRQGALWTLHHGRFG